MSREVAFIEAFLIVDVAGPDAFDANNGSVSSLSFCDVHDIAVVSVSDAVGHDVSLGHDSISLSGGNDVSNDILTVAGCETSRRANQNASIACSLVGHESVSEAGGVEGHNSFSVEGGVACRDSLSLLAGGFASRDGLSIAGWVVDRYSFL